MVETTSLGLPQLPQTGNPTSLSSLLTGSHTIKVYYQDAQHFRLSIPQPESETDVISQRRQAVALGVHRELGDQVHPPAAAKAKHAQPKLPQTAAHPAAGRQPGAHGGRQDHPGLACRPT